MRITTNLPRAGTRMDDVWIPMSDGARLAATIWLPTDASEQPVPVVLDYKPYRKNDLNSTRDARHRYLAGHGYASVKVDIRGSGDSDGIIYDEYAPQEQLDAVEIIAWLASQPWCSGKVGMWGITSSPRCRERSSSVSPGNGARVVVPLCVKVVVPSLCGTP